MRVFELMNGRALGYGVLVDVVLLCVGVGIVGTNPSDTELHLIFWPACVVGGAIALLVMHRDYQAGLEAGAMRDQGASR